jgi:hypothetical protein
MSIVIGPYIFPSVSSDEEADVLHLKTRTPGEAVDFDQTPEGGATRFNAAGELVGLTIVRPKTGLERHGKVALTLPPQRVGLSSTAFGDALAAA